MNIKVTAFTESKKFYNSKSNNTTFKKEKNKGDDKPVWMHSPVCTFVVLV